MRPHATHSLLGNLDLLPLKFNCLMQQQTAITLAGSNRKLYLRVMLKLVCTFSNNEIIN